MWLWFCSTVRILGSSLFFLLNFLKPCIIDKGCWSCKNECSIYLCVSLFGSLGVEVCGSIRGVRTERTGDAWLWKHIGLLSMFAFWGDNHKEILPCQFSHGEIILRNVLWYGDSWYLLNQGESLQSDVVTASCHHVGVHSWEIFAMWNWQGEKQRQWFQPRQTWMWESSRWWRQAFSLFSFCALL